MKEIQPQQLAKKQKTDEEVNVIDVREDEEVAQGKIPGAKHIPLGQITDRINELDENSYYYVVCRSGGRSGRACEILAAKGFDVTNIAGGMLAWEDETE
ncbi:Rhodanese-related sulfurtransferase [Salinibacillus kushneri]|uniref:Rhodanese-related sulfurtransferase n=1 Tax=Salinibacillus kushneri TaxID=237682 RepID=A0A1I0JK43_9BACI|nr:rhodanese-like domain-containing protein [Salinibacillus kushneri]SEU09859.1 Rhodanese-related sulfurtransferase [Salinibacillus kushneri]